MRKEKQYIQAIDFIRVISISAVILIHTTTRTLEATSFNFTRIPWSLFLNQITRFAVPLFFMISGFVLELNYQYSLNYFSYLKRRIGKIFVPYFFWSLVYYFLIYKQHSDSFLSALISGSSSHQLYFIPTLLIFYLIFPIIHKISGFLFRKWILIFLGILQLIILRYDYYVSPLPIIYQLGVLLLNFYVFFLGMFAARNKNSMPLIISKWKFILISFVLFLAGYIFYEGRSRYLLTHNYLSFYSQWRPSVFLYTIFLAIVLYYFFNKKVIFPAIIRTLSNLSFFVFFIHIIILEVVWHYIGLKMFSLINSDFLYLLFDLFYFILVVSLSYFIAYISHEIPYLSRLTS